MYYSENEFHFSFYELFQHFLLQLIQIYCYKSILKISLSFVIYQGVNFIEILVGIILSNALILFCIL